MEYLKLLLLLLLTASCCLATEDYYETLGITREADLKEIRRAFKKIALKMHPDKNVNDPEAHDKFVHINHIYEVLKDEDMRKKYDKYGEEGLKDDQRGGGRYESYQYYKEEFGIYDDDPEVVTLDGGDFDASVNSGEVWFVNFYSPRCHHCHELAPTWRIFAAEMSGVVNIGAVNCHDNHWTCNNNGIHSFPSLVLFTKNNRPIKYKGDRSKKDLMRFVLEHVNVEVVELWDGNWEEEMKLRTNIPWLISFCDDDADCPSRTTKRKLAGRMNGLANVGSVDCESSPDLCKRAGAHSGVYYFPLNAFPDPQSEDKVHRFASLDAREIYEDFMASIMPDLQQFTTKSLEKIIKTKHALIFFQFDENKEADHSKTDLKKLPSVLSEFGITVAKVGCFDTKWCQDNLKIKEDAVVLFKGRKSYEIYHGRTNVAELSSFAQESSNAKVMTLTPEFFEGQTIKSESSNPWFVDFFAPWCPPCRALLPELRKVSLNLENINFGTVDCTAFRGICEQFSITSYPTTMLFNNSATTEYTGHHNVRGIMQFVQDLIQPPYEHLSPESFRELVQLREPGVTWMVDFYANWCGPCRALLPAWRNMAKLLEGVVKVGAIDCAKPGYKEFCSLQSVDSYPEIRLFPSKKKARSNPLYKKFEGWNRNAHTMAGWALETMPNEVVNLELSDFKDGQPVSEDAWLLDFYTPWCGHCKSFAPKFTLTSFRFKGRVKFGKVDCQQLPSVCQAVGVHAYPTVYFYPPIVSGDERNSKKNVQSQDPDVITNLVNGYMKQYNHLVKEKKKKSSKDEL